MSFMANPLHRFCQVTAGSVRAMAAVTWGPRCHGRRGRDRLERMRLADSAGPLRTGPGVPRAVLRPRYDGTLTGRLGGCVRECGCRGVPGRTRVPARSGPLPGREP